MLLSVVDNGTSVKTAFTGALIGAFTGALIGAFTGAFTSLREPNVDQTSTVVSLCLYLFLYLILTSQGLGTQFQSMPRPWLVRMPYLGIPDAAFHVRQAAACLLHSGFVSPVAPAAVHNYWLHRALHGLSSSYWLYRALHGLSSSSSETSCSLRLPSTDVLCRMYCCKPCYQCKQLVHLQLCWLGLIPTAQWIGGRVACVVRAQVLGKERADTSINLVASHWVLHCGVSSQVRQGGQLTEHRVWRQQPPAASNYVLERPLFP